MKTACLQLGWGACVHERGGGITPCSSTPRRSGAGSTPERAPPPSPPLGLPSLALPPPPPQQVLSDVPDPQEVQLSLSAELTVVVGTLLAHVQPLADSLSLADLRDTRTLHLLLCSLRALWRQVGTVLQDGSEPPAGWQQEVSSCLSLSGSIVQLVKTLGFRDVLAGGDAKEALPFLVELRFFLVRLVPMLSWR